MQQVGMYCVVGPNCGKLEGQYSRKWFSTEAQAVEHAASLLKGRPAGSTPAFVVRVEKIVEVAHPPLTVRSPVMTDVVCAVSGY